VSFCKSYVDHSLSLIKIFRLTELSARQQPYSSSPKSRGPTAHWSSYSLFLPLATEAVHRPHSSLPIFSPPLATETSQTPDSSSPTFFPPLAPYHTNGSFNSASTLHVISRVSSRFSFSYRAPTMASHWPRDHQSRGKFQQ